MIEILASVAVLLLIVVVALLVQLTRRPAADIGPLVAKVDTLRELQDRGERSFREEFARGRMEATNLAQGQRDELQKVMLETTNSLIGSVERLSRFQKEKFDDFEKRLEKLTSVIETKLGAIQSENATKLEEMRKTVDEKLQGALEKRLGESFKLVSERLEAVHKGLGEMQNLATGVGDLKRVLTNVKTRGTWGEMQLGSLLEQVLTKEQFERNVSTAGRGVVEFAIKLPGRDEVDGKQVWLPIDAKFPKEDYERLVDAAERGDAAAVESASKDLDTRVRNQAKDIREKYLNPPMTTDFALLYLPTEGLYAEVLRRPGLVDSIQRDLRVVVVGPTTLAAVLNSLQMGFRTLAIQKRSSEVWKVLGAVKTEFGKFGEVLDKVKKKLDEAGNVIEDAGTRRRAVERSLKQVEALPTGEAPPLSERAPGLFEPLTGK